MKDEIIYTIGVDGGGSHCRGRIRDQNGNLIAEQRAGPANIHINFSDSLRTVRSLINSLIEKSGNSSIRRTQIALGLGLAGIIASGDAVRVNNEFPDFGNVCVDSDAVIACLGAHGDRDGGVVIVGTGSAGIARINEQTHSIGGRGFMLGDEGSGARIGLASLKQAVRAADDLREHTPLTRRLMAHFADDILAVIQWSQTAKPSDFATFAPLIFKFADNGDAVALPIIKEAAKAIDTLALAIARRGVRQIALVGGISGVLLPYLTSNSEFDWVEAKRDAIDGAILLAGGKIL